MSERRRRRGILSAEDRALWRKVAASAKPLRPQPLEARELVEAAPSPAPVQRAPDAPPRPLRPRTSPAAPISLDRRTLREIARGHQPVQERIDLHGFTRADAHDRLVSFLQGAQSRGTTLVLVISGKGRSPDERSVFTPDERGVLRRLVPQWLDLPALRPIVLGYSSAGPTHGGAGAFYVRLRRRR